MNERLLKILSWTWPVSAAFDARPLRGTLWCFALERGIHGDDLEFALQLLDEVRSEERVLN